MHIRRNITLHGGRPIPFFHGLRSFEVSLIESYEGSVFGSRTGDSESHISGLGDIEIVSERDPIAFRGDLDLKLVVTVEGHSLDGCLALGTPVKPDFLAMVLHGQITLLEGRGKKGKPAESQPGFQGAGCQHACGKGRMV